MVLLAPLTLVAAAVVVVGTEVRVTAALVAPGLLFFVSKVLLQSQLVLV